MPADEVVEVGHLGQHVVADDEVGRAARRATSSLGAARAPKNSRQRRDAALARAASATFAAGSMPRHGMPARDEVLQQVAVVAGELDDEAVRRRGRGARRSSSA